MLFLTDHVFLFSMMLKVFGGKKNSFFVLFVFFVVFFDKCYFVLYKCISFFSRNIPTVLAETDDFIDNKIAIKKRQIIT